jgi:carbon-monoxide dehydrogenase medium subunit
VKLPAFDYATPNSIGEAVALLAASGGGARPLSGGQTLMPLLAFRLTAPSLLVDLRGIPGLDAVEIGAAGTRLGARVRWCDIEAHAGLAEAQPLLVAAIGHVAHYQIRKRGTLGGSMAHADPAAEMPGVAVACDGVLHLVGASGARDVMARDFFLGPLTTALAADELITGITLPAWPHGRRWGFQEFARRRGDFALAGVAVHYDDVEGRAVNAHVAVIGACSAPHRVAAAEAVLEGSVVTPAIIAEVGRAVSAGVDPPEDIHATAAYRRSLAGTLAERALVAAGEAA